MDNIEEYLFINNLYRMAAKFKDLSCEPNLQIDLDDATAEIVLTSVHKDVSISISYDALDSFSWSILFAGADSEELINELFPILRASFSLLSVERKEPSTLVLETKTPHFTDPLPIEVISTLSRPFRLP
jgi:hypothetical protein